MSNCPQLAGDALPLHLDWHFARIVICKGHSVTVLPKNLWLYVR